MANHNSILCPNCGNYTYLTARAEYSFGGISREIAECNGCNFYFLVERAKSSIVINKIYPNELAKRLNPKTPGFLVPDMKEANNCFASGSFRAAGVMARRALQLCCIEKGAPGGTLNDQVDWLLTKQIITVDLKNWAHEVRLLGNDAAHPSKDISKDQPITKEDAEDMLTLLEQFVEVLYITPELAEERRLKRTGAVSIVSKAPNP